MVPSYSLLQVQEDRIPRFRGVRENVDSRPDYSGFQDGLVSWPRDCRGNEWAGISESYPSAAKRWTAARVTPPPSGDRWLRPGKVNRLLSNRGHPLPSGGRRREQRLHRLATGGYAPIESAEGAISFNPQPTARNLTKPARILRLGQNAGGDTTTFATPAAFAKSFSVTST